MTQYEREIKQLELNIKSFSEVYESAENEVDREVAENAVEEYSRGLEVYRKAQSWEALKNSLQNGIDDLAKLKESEVRNNTIHAYKSVLITMDKAESEDE